jgi:hypothetical protein
MTKEHIPFEELEFEDTPDPSHLKDCEECRKKWEIFSFLGFQVKVAPRVDPPPFFGQRVARLAETPVISFVALFQRVAQQLIPVFVAVVLVSSFLLYRLAETEPAMEDYASIFFEEPVPEDFSVEDVVDSLGEMPEEELVQ